jgi:CBS domain-containing protein
MFSMKIREAMTPNPVCCVPTDTAQKVAQILRDQNVGALPVVADKQSLKLIGMITDRDICCSIVAEGLDPKTTTIVNYVSSDLVTCRDGENLDNCQQAMQERQIRRIPIVDGEGRCVGIVSQADLALKDKPEKVSKTVSEISKPKPQRPSVAA